MPSGDTIVVVDFYAGGPDALPTLTTETGARLLGDTAAKLAGPETAGQVAQSGGVTSDAALGEPIGSVDAMKGTATVIRADGTEEPLEAGSQIFENDTIVTGPDSALGVLFVDDSTMSMGGEARLVVDQMVYDDSTQSGNQLFDVVQGAFVFASGHIGKANPEDVEVRTPVATIGIRGTKYGIDVGAQDGETAVTLFEGAVVVRNAGGEQVLSSVGQTTRVTGFERAPGEIEMMDPLEQARVFGEAIAYSPTQPPLEESGEGNKDPTDGDQALLDEAALEELAEQLNDLETAAGPSGAIAAVTKSAAFLRLMSQLLEGGSGDLSGVLTADTSNDNNPFDTGVDEGSNASGTLDGDDAGPGSVADGGSDALPGGSISGSYSYNFDPNDPVVGSVSGGSGVDLFTISMASSAVPTGWTVSQDSSGQVVITESNGTVITMDDVEELGLDLGSGSDSVDVGALGDTDIINETVYIDGGAGDDTITAADLDKRLVAEGGDGDDVITGGAYAGGDETSQYSGDYLSGGAGDDVIIGGAGDDEILGGAGDDVIRYAVGDGADVIDGGAGADTLEIVFTEADLADSGVLADLKALAAGQQGTFEALGITVSNLESVTLNGPSPDPSVAVSFSIEPGVEDAPTDLTISVDAPDSAALSTTVTLAGLPAGYTLVNAAGDEFAGGGDIALSTDQLDGLQILAPADASGDFSLSVTAETTNLLTGESASDSSAADLSIAGAADAPSLAVEDAAGVEDGEIALDLTALTTDASETLTITISGLPDGAALSAGTVQPDGSLLLTADELDGLTLTPPANSDVDFTLSVVATSADGANSASVSGEIAVSLAAEADAPVLTIGETSVSGVENGAAIPLDIQAALTDIDGSESLTIRIDGLPSGATLSAGQVQADGSVLLTAEELDGLTLTPAPGSDADFTLSVTATATEADGGDAAVATGSIAVDVAASAAAPALTVNDAAGSEDQAIPLDLTAAVQDSDALTITVTGLPQGASLSAGQIQPDGSVILTAADLSGLTVTPPANSAADFDLTVTATASDGGDAQSVQKTLSVSVAAAADAPSVTVSDVSGAEARAGDDVLNGTSGADQLTGGGGADTLTGGAGNDVLIGDGANGAASVSLALGAQLGADLDGSESLTVTLAGLPNGVVLTDASGAVYDTVSFTPDQLQGLQAIVPAGTGDFTVSVTTTVTDVDPDGGSDSASFTDSFTVTIDQGAGAGDDVLDGGTGADTLIAGDGDDSLSLTVDPDAGQDVVDGGTGADALTLTVGPMDLLDADIVSDLIDLADWIASGPAANEERLFESLSLKVQNVESLTILDLDGQSVSVEALRTQGVVIEGGDDADQLTGGAGDDTISGGGGDDVIEGGAGDDVIDGGDGDDQIDGGDGGDSLYGGSGDDVLTGGGEDDVIKGGDGDDTLTGGGGADRISGDAGDDLATFSYSADGPGASFDGGDGYDTLRIELNSGMDQLDQAMADVAAAIKAAKLDPDALQTVDSLGLSFENFEDVQLYVDGQEQTFAPTVSGLQPLDIDTDALFAGVQVARDVAIDDADSPTLMQASVTISSGMQSGDALTIEESVLEATGLTILSAGVDGDGNFTLTLGGDAPAAAYEEAIAAVRLINDDVAPTPGAREISVRVTDDDGVASAPATAGVDVDPAAPSLKDADAADNDTVAFVSEATGDGAVVEDLAEYAAPQTMTETLSLTVAKTGVGSNGQGQGSNGKFEVVINGVSLGVFTATVALGQLDNWQTIDIPGIDVTEGETLDIEIKAFNQASNVLVNRVELGDRVFEAESDADSLTGSIEDGYVALQGGSVGFSIATAAPDGDAFDSWLLETAGGEQALDEEDLGQFFDGVDMGDGQDWVAAAEGVEQALNVNLSGDVWTGAEHVAGGRGDDVLVGDQAANILAGGDGDDRIVGEGEDDLLLGGAGDDTLEVSGDDLSGMGGSVDYGDRADALDQAFDANSADGLDGLDGGRSGIDGGSGYDTLKLAGAPSDGSIDGEDVEAVTNIEALDVSEAEGVVDVNLSLDDVVSMTDEDNELTILKGQDDTVKIGDQEYDAGTHQLSLDGMSITLIIADDDQGTTPDSA
ncbi:MAG: FecR domain-containing protein [Marivibrio sp.]|uniref:FecR domain-containing protein n=1 Tax=Marivibrio sp. TaxID=2039719 RepID=UPI0032EA9405